MILKVLTVDDKLAEIKRLYYKTTRATITQDIAKAIDLLKSMPGEAERERVAVYMDGLSQMRSDWTRKEKARETRKNEKGRTNRGRKRTL